MIFGSLVLVVVYATFAFTGIYPYLPMILLGIAFFTHTGSYVAIIG